MTNKQNLKIIISSPSGAGKTTVTKKILKKLKSSYLSVSCTTRDPRVGEKNNVDYNFVTRSKFLNLKKKNKFIETAKVFENYYGTLKSEIYKDKKIILLDVDWQGARNLRKSLLNNCYSFFLLPPNLKELKKRLLKRHKDNKKIALKRIASAKKDVKHWIEYDYVFINDNLNYCVKKIINQINYLQAIKTQENIIRKILKKF